VKLYRTSLAGLALSVLVANGCRRDDSTALADVRPFRPTIAAMAVYEPPLEILTVAVPDDLPVFVLSGRGGSCPRTVFMHGMCGHGMGYLQAFQVAGRDRGGVMGLQGDIDCGGGTFRKYTANPAKQDERIRDAFAAVCGSDAEADDLVLMGYSQGAYIAERMAEQFPSRYSRVVLIGAPTTPSAARLRHVRGAVMISGEFDAKYRMKEGAQDLISARIPAAYMEMPGAYHGQMSDAERIMGDALDWLDDNALPPP
jgi:pimeloyl-ACP methyl ester carboxylesterase